MATSKKIEDLAKIIFINWFNLDLNPRIETIIPEALMSPNMKLDYHSYIKLDHLNPKFHHYLEFPVIIRSHVGRFLRNKEINSKNNVIVVPLCIPHNVSNHCYSIINQVEKRIICGQTCGTIISISYKNNLNFYIGHQTILDDNLNTLFMVTSTINVTLAQKLHQLALPYSIINFKAYISPKVYEEVNSLNTFIIKTLIPAYMIIQKDHPELNLEIIIKDTNFIQKPEMPTESPDKLNEGIHNFLMDHINSI